ncbi:hypothetical protein [uncultured Massilia sp.]|uniref:hypothetical protein n=1 Tax=uncultured Massilia sp. TaxID=169973 RepID=UPI0025FAECB1|nr:hypothetical protein [uncultured Massilia sp.]
MAILLKLEWWVLGAPEVSWICPGNRWDQYAAPSGSDKRADEPFFVARGDTIEAVAAGRPGSPRWSGGHAEQKNLNPNAIAASTSTMPCATGLSFFLLH